MKTQAADVCQCTCLLAYLRRVPDPRRPRGVRHAWWVILALIAAGTLAGQDNARALAQWAREQQRVLRAYLPLWHGQPPSAATFQRALSGLDRAALEATARHYLARSSQPGAAFALDGKSVRGASSDGRRVHLVALAEHGTGRVRAQAEVDQKANELAVAPELLAGLQPGEVVSVDALFCQRSLARQVVAAKAHYLMAVKDNQPGLAADLRFFFEAPRGGRHPLPIETQSWLELNRGRLEQRTVECSVGLNEYLDWPGLGQVVRRTCRRERAELVELDTHYYVTSLSPAEADLGRLARLLRDHWSIENRTHRVRDVTFGEDACRLRSGSAAVAMATFRNLVMALIQDAGWVLYTDARRHYAAHPHSALTAIGCQRL